MNIKLPVSLDVLVLLILVPAFMQEQGQSFLLSVALLFYIGCELVYPLSGYKVLPQQFGKTRLAFLIRLLLLFIIIFAAAGLPMIENVIFRIFTEPEPNGYTPAYLTLHDGALQMEIAVAAFTEGVNPYVMRFDDTPMKFHTQIGGIDVPEMPYFHYFAYLPGYVMLSAPIYELFSQLGVFYDQRLVYFLFYLLLILLLPAFAKAPAHKLLLIAAVALNPKLVNPVVAGMNDIVVIFFLVLTCYLTMKKKLLWAALFLGLTCTVKQSAWFFVPFYALFVWQMIPAEERQSTILKMIGIMAIFPILFLLPFFFWDTNAFITDIFSYPAGNVEFNYPIRGYTLGVVLVGLGIIQSPLDSFPFWIFQLLVGVPLLVFLFKYQWQRQNIGIMLICASFFTFAFGSVSRFFQENYLGYVVVIMSLGILIEPVTEKLFQGQMELTE